MTREEYLRVILHDATNERSAAKVRLRRIADYARAALRNNDKPEED